MIESCRLAHKNNANTLEITFLTSWHCISLPKVKKINSRSLRTRKQIRNVGHNSHLFMFYYHKIIQAEYEIKLKLKVKVNKLQLDFLFLPVLLWLQRKGNARRRTSTITTAPIIHIIFSALKEVVSHFQVQISTQ